MKLLRGLTNGVGSSDEVKLCPHDADDMWNLYNLIHVGDIVSSKTSRKVVKPGSGSSKSTTERIIIPKLSVQVTSVDWDGTTNQIRISGTVPNTTTSYSGDNIKRGQFHTLQLETGINAYLQKSPWESHDVDMLKNATTSYKDVSAAAVVMQSGLAHVCLITRTMCPTLAKIELAIPKKRAINNQIGTINKFYTYVAEALLQLPSTITCFVIASPAFVGIDFFDFLQKKYPDQLKWLFPITRIMHASSGHKHALLEALSDGSLGSILTNSSLDIERTALNEFLSLLNTHQFQAYYGLKDVSTLIQDYPGSISTLMILDKLFKDPDPIERKRYISMSETVKRNGGRVLVFSSLNPTSEQLAQLTGIACILSYDIEDLQNEQEYIELESYINTALDISPLHIPKPHTMHFSSTKTNDDNIDDLDEFICNNWQDESIHLNDYDNSINIRHTHHHNNNNNNEDCFGNNEFLTPSNLLKNASITSMKSTTSTTSTKSSKKDKKDSKDTKDSTSTSKSSKHHSKDKKSHKNTNEPSNDDELDDIGGQHDRYEDLGDFF